jgi:hypothetical protein
MKASSLKHAILFVCFVGIAVLSALPGSAAPAEAQMGIVSVGGSPTSGGEINYRFDLSTTASGTLVVKAKIRGANWKATFPELSISPALGLSVVEGPYISIPRRFQGPAVLRVKAFFNGTRIGRRAVLVIIGPPPPVPGLVTTNLYDVGFENLVTLDGSIVPTTGMELSRTYSWTQTGGKPVTLSADDVVSPSFTTDALTNFVTMGTAMFFTDVDEDGVTNRVYVTREDRFATNNVSNIALDAEHAAASTYNFRLLVSDGSVTRTGLFTVACSLQSPAQPNIPVGVTAYYRAATNSMDWALINRPAGSLATLNHTNGLIAQLRPDVEGPYVILDNVTGKTVTNVAARWTSYQFCGICHGPGNNVGQADMVSLWSQTKHATFFQRAIDGQTAAGQHYSESCYACHTVGYNNAPAANNGGFDDVAKTLGWKLPSVLQPGNYAAMPEQLKNLASIQCESCHGPGSRHPGSASVTTDVRVCGQCHQDGDRHFRPQQWEISPHSGGFENISNTRGVNPQCSRCHSPFGFIALAKGTADAGTTNSVPTGAGALTCQSCHNPHDRYGNPDRKQLRVYDSALLGNPYFRSNTVEIALGESLTTADPRLTNSNVVVTGLGSSAACIVCHNGRQLPTQVQLYGASAGKMFYQTGGPHLQTAGEAFLGFGMFDYGQVMGNSFHTYLAECRTCHMYQLRAPVNGVAQDAIAIDGVDTPVTQVVYDQFANALGNHTFKMNYEYRDSSNVEHEAENIAACNQCHAGIERVDKLDFRSVFGRDYDGNGVTEGVQTETQGVLNNLGFLLKTTGVSITTNAVGNVISVSTSTGYSTNDVIKEAQRKAAWNWLACYREGSFGVHNTQYTTRLLQTTYTDLSTNYYGDATRTYQAAFPNAFLR